MVGRGLAPAINFPFREIDHVILPDGKGILFLRHKIPGGSKPPPYINDVKRNYTGKQNQESGIENNS